MSDERYESGKYAGYVNNINAGGHPGYMVKTFGCQMNESDSEKLAGWLEAMGYRPAVTEEDCSFIIFNTCCVRESAEQRLFGHLGEMKKYKTANKDLVLAVCGCMMQQEGVAEKIRRSYPYADIIFGANSMHKLPRLLHEVLTQRRRAVDLEDDPAQGIAEGMPAVRSSGISAYVPIMHGCDNFCTYCIVPYVRGREKSRDPKDILDEMRGLAGEGIKEITLLGQNVNSYDGGISFAGLLRKAGGIDGIERVRFMTSHPKDIGRDILEAIHDTDAVCNHLHLPLQSGSDRILGLMNRNYSRDSYFAILDMAREIMPGIGLSTDIIVGFPGETEEDFQDTMDALERVRFDFAFTFIYSRRKGTPAAEMPGEVPDGIKHDRFDRMLGVQNRITLERNKASIGTVETVLVEGTSRTDPSMMTGRTGSNKIVNFRTGGTKAGGFAEILITDARTWHLEGELYRWK
ncbi:MAG: tRNA (N6-isopentenyl adenosine(37)-C2)-methylthiotransferase MiaB [Clostridia bacterium]|nr:tRNA (N6-isopentenyl adenosine(37)-C2)-methylthiotransferase MiaB [Clostridia bacterium]